jgi:hypothetical protein
MHTETAHQTHRVLVSKREAAASLGISVRHFERFVQRSLPYVPSGQLRLFHPHDLEHWALSRTNPALTTTSKGIPDG